MITWSSHRESWRFNPADLVFAAEKDEVARFVRTREWAAALGIPRYVFVKSNAELKPVYVDFTSPIYVNVLAKMVRRTNAAERLPDKTITVVEMLPVHDDLWLADHEGNRYTSEFRFTWVDDRRLEETPRDSYGNFGPDNQGHLAPPPSQTPATSTARPRRGRCTGGKPHQ